MDMGVISAKPTVASSCCLLYAGYSTGLPVPVQFRTGRPVPLKVIGRYLWVDMPKIRLLALYQQDSCSMSRSADPRFAQCIESFKLGLCWSTSTTISLPHLQAAKEMAFQGFISERGKWDKGAGNSFGTAWKWQQWCTVLPTGLWPPFISPLSASVNAEVLWYWLGDGRNGSLQLAAVEMPISQQRGVNRRKPISTQEVLPSPQKFIWVEHSIPETFDSSLY